MNPSSALLIVDQKLATFSERKNSRACLGHRYKKSLLPCSIQLGANVLLSVSRADCSRVLSKGMQDEPEGVQRSYTYWDHLVSEDVLHIVGPCTVWRIAVPSTSAGKEPGAIETLQFSHKSSTQLVGEVGKRSPCPMCTWEQSLQSFVLPGHTKFNLMEVLSTITIMSMFGSHFSERVRALLEVDSAPDQIYWEAK